MDFQNAMSLCRICLEKDPEIPLFEKTECKPAAVFKLSFCLNEKCEDIIGLPRFICNECNDSLDIAYRLIQKCKKSNKLLYEKILCLKNETFDYKVEINSLGTPNSSDDGPDEFNSENNINNHMELPFESNNKQDLAVHLDNLSQSEKKVLDVKNEASDSKCKIASMKKIKKHLKERRNRKSNIPKEKPKKDKVKCKTERKDKEARKEIPSVHLCELCGCSCKTKLALQRHITNEHMEKIKLYCPQCLYSGFSQYNLDMHIKRVHSKDKKFTCPQCGHNFAFEKDMRSHIKMVHMKHLLPKKLFGCSYCEVKFKSRQARTIHERSIHTGERPEVCDICKTTFVDKGYLRSHMRLHTGETPFKCPICQRGYAQLCNMKSHLRNHRKSEIDADTLSKIRPNYLKYMKD